MIWNAILAGFTDSGMVSIRKKEKMLQRIPCTEMLGGGILVEDMHLGMRAHLLVKEYDTKIDLLRIKHSSPKDQRWL